MGETQEPNGEVVRCVVVIECPYGTSRLGKRTPRELGGAMQDGHRASEGAEGGMAPAATLAAYYDGAIVALPAVCVAQTVPARLGISVSALR